MLLFAVLRSAQLWGQELYLYYHLPFFFFFFLPCGLPLCWGTLPLELVICWTLAGFLASPAPLRIEGIFWITNEEKSFEKHLKLYLCPHSTA